MKREYGVKMRKITSLTAALTFIIVILTSIILYIVPHGRVAYWADWHLWGLSKDDWGNIHINTGLLFLIALLLHTYYNWKSLMAYLKDRGCGIAFLSVDTERETHPLYERLGFKMLAQPLTYSNCRGELKQSDGGMVAPLGSRELSERVLHGDAEFALTPEAGYW